MRMLALGLKWGWKDACLPSRNREDRVDPMQLVGSYKVQECKAARRNFRSRKSVLVMAGIAYIKSFINRASLRFDDVGPPRDDSRVEKAVKDGGALLDVSSSVLIELPDLALPDINKNDSRERVSSVW